MWHRKKYIKQDVLSDTPILLHQIYATSHLQHEPVICTEMSQTTQSLLKNFHLCKLYMRPNGSSLQKYCSSFTDSYRLYPKKFLKQSFQRTARSLTLDAGKSIAPMQYMGSLLEYCHNVWYGKLKWCGWRWKSLMICLAVLTEYRRASDRRTDRRTSCDNNHTHRAVKWLSCCRQNARNWYFVDYVAQW